MKRTTDQISHSQTSRQSHYRIHPEWITLAIASLVVAVIIGLICFIWITQDTQPPVLAIRREQPIRQAGGQYYVPFVLTNEGGGTAETVQVVGELQINGTTEIGEQQVDFLSAGEEQEGAFVFSQNPAQGELSLRVASYKLP
ncbi:MAG: hypothetical protein Kow00121_25170 [Elainellaceae cyanobacterium]